MVMADKGYYGDVSRKWLAKRGIASRIPPRRNRKTPSPFSKASYRKRHLVENFFERIKNWHRVVIRYDKFAQNILRLRLPRRHSGLSPLVSLQTRPRNA